MMCSIPCIYITQALFTLSWFYQNHDGHAFCLMYLVLSHLLYTEYQGLHQFLCFAYCIVLLHIYVIYKYICISTWISIPIYYDDISIPKVGVLLCFFCIPPYYGREYQIICLKFVCLFVVSRTYNTILNFTIYGFSCMTHDIHIERCFFCEAYEEASLMGYVHILKKQSKIMGLCSYKKKAE